MYLFCLYTLELIKHVNQNDYESIYGYLIMYSSVLPSA